MKPIVMLTGADGFVGCHLTRAFAARGWEVHGLVRDAATKQRPPGLSACFEYSLEAGPEAKAFEVRPEVLIHCAFQTTGAAGTGAGAMNLRAAKLLVDSFARKRGSLFVFVSSMSAHDGAYSSYGRSKREIELTLDLEKSLVIRPGFLIGPGGIFQRLARTLRNTRVAPMPYGGQMPIQTADIAELCRAMAQLAEERATGLYSFGEAQPIPISRFYAAIARWMGKPVTLVPVPGTPILHIVRMLERVGNPLPLSSENLLGLRGLIAQDVGPLAARIGWQPSAISAILERYDPRTILG